LRERNGSGEARQLDKQSATFLQIQRNLESELDELLSEEAIHFQTQLTRATNLLAEYRLRTGRLRELRKTIEVNRRIYLLNAISLISDEGRNKLVRSRDRYAAAKEILDKNDEDQIFGSDLGTIGQHFHQLTTDLEYARSLIERHSSSLRSGDDQISR
jgi:hypothetical protein